MAPEMGVIDINRHDRLPACIGRMRTLERAGEMPTAAVEGLPRGSSRVIRMTNWASWMFFDEKLTELAAMMVMRASNA